MRKKRSERQEKQTLEYAAQKYRDCVLSSGDIDTADLLLDAFIRPPCKALMQSYGVEWDSELERFLCTVLLYFSRFEGKTFISFFLYHARNNFHLPDKPIVEHPGFDGTGLHRFQRTHESQEEMILLHKHK